MTMNESLIQKKEQAEKILEEINIKHQQIIKVKESCDELLKVISNSYGENKKINAALNLIKNRSEVLIRELDAHRGTINNQYTNANLFYTKKYLPLVEKIENSESGFSAKLSYAKNLTKEIAKETSLIEKQYDEIKKQASEYRAITNSIKNLETSTRKVYEFVQDKKPKIEDILKEIQGIEGRIKSSNIEINKLLKESSSSYLEINAYKDKSNNDYNLISSNKDNSDKILESIREIYEIAARTGLSGEFENRRNKLNDEIKKWESRLLIVTILLLLGIVGLFVFQLSLYDWDIEAHTFNVNFYIRFLIVSPIVYYLYFCASQHDKAKKLFDKYSFKTTLAMSIKSHIELLLSNKYFQKEERIDTILEFIINGFNKIYNEPYSDEDYKLKLKLANLELDIENRIMEKIIQDSKNK